MKYESKNCLVRKNHHNLRINCTSNSACGARLSVYLSSSRFDFMEASVFFTPIFLRKLNIILKARHFIRRKSKIFLAVQNNGQDSDYFDMKNSVIAHKFYTQCLHQSLCDVRHKHEQQSIQATDRHRQPPASPAAGAVAN